MTVEPGCVNVGGVSATAATVSSVVKLPTANWVTGNCRREGWKDSGLRRSMEAGMSDTANENSRRSTRATDK